MLKDLTRKVRPLWGGKRIIQFSPPRTGSTLVFNVLREIFPNRRIDKLHNYELKFKKYSLVVTYRHPLDALASSIQRYGRTPTDEEIEKQIEEFENNGLWDLLKIRHQPNVLMLKYEDFYNHYDYIFDRLENFFSINISSRKREEISRRYNMEAVLEITAGYDNFGMYDSVTQLHGKHISSYKGAVHYYDTFFTPAQVEYLKKVYNKILVEFEYH
jgi:hypothetical protein